MVPMTTTQRLSRLSPDECTALLGPSGSFRVGSVSIDGGSPVRLACLCRPDGSVLIPTGLDRDLVTAAAGRSVTIDFEVRKPDGPQHWLVRVVGDARPMARRDRPRAPDTATALTMSYVFENGIHVGVHRMTGRADDEAG